MRIVLGSSSSVRNVDWLGPGSEPIAANSDTLASACPLVTRKRLVMSSVSAVASSPSSTTTVKLTEAGSGSVMPTLGARVRKMPKSAVRKPPPVGSSTSTGTPTFLHKSWAVAPLGTHESVTAIEATRLLGRRRIGRATLPPSEGLVAVVHDAARGSARSLCLYTRRLPPVQNKRRVDPGKA